MPDTGVCPLAMDAVAETANLPSVRDCAVLDGAAAADRAAGGENLTASVVWQDHGPGGC